MWAAFQRSDVAQWPKDSADYLLQNNRLRRPNTKLSHSNTRLRFWVFEKLSHLFEFWHSPIFLISHCSFLVTLSFFIVISCVYIRNCSIIAAWKILMQMREGLIQKVVQKVKKLLVNKDKNTASDFFISIKHLSKTNARGFGFTNFT